MVRMTLKHFTDRYCSDVMEAWATAGTFLHDGNRYCVTHCCDGDLKIAPVEIIPETVEPSVVNDVCRGGEDNTTVITASHDLDPIKRGSNYIAIVWHTNTPEGQANLNLYKNAERIKREHEEMYQWIKTNQELHPTTGKIYIQQIRRDEIIAEIEKHRGCKDGC